MGATLTPLFVDAATPCRHTVGARWFVDETYVKVVGSWRYVYGAIDEYRPVIDVQISRRRDITAASAHVIAKLTPDAVRNCVDSTARYSIG